MLRRHSKYLKKNSSLPSRLRLLFWEYEFDQLSWAEDEDLVVSRVLIEGDWPAVQWLRRRLGDPGLRAWLLRTRGRGLSPKQLRFWELVLELPRRQVDAWLADPSRQVWDGRSGPMSFHQQ